MLLYCGNKEALIYMALLEKNLVIKRSKIPGAGKGLFTKQFIEKDTLIVEYKGKRITWKEAKAQEAFNGYVYYIKRDQVIDAKNHLKSFGRFANDANGINKIKGITNNCRYVVDGDKVFLKATKKITVGGEILVAYGKEYWDAVRYNKKHGFL
jgi:SET domain-containing protein